MSKSETGWQLSDAGIFHGRISAPAIPGGLLIAPPVLDASTPTGEECEECIGKIRMRKSN